MVSRHVVLGFAAIAVVVGSAAFIRQAAIEEEQEGLLARAKISAESARQTALSKFPGGQITESEIEEEDGRLIYSFDLEVNGEKAEVEIDAVTGEVVSAGIEADDDDDDDDDDDAESGKGK